MSFLDPLILREPKSGKGEWTLMGRLRYQGARDEFIVPVGFTTDGASVPRALWTAIPPFGRYLKAAVLHDYLYVHQPVSRRDADRIFRRTMKEAGVGLVKRNAMYAAVRAFGRFVWKEKP